MDDDATTQRLTNSLFVAALQNRDWRGAEEALRLGAPINHAHRAGPARCSWNLPRQRRNLASQCKPILGILDGPWTQRRDDDDESQTKKKSPEPKKRESPACIC